MVETRYTYTTVECPYCHKVQKIRTYVRFDGVKEPNLKQKVLNRTFFEHRCKNCRSDFFAEQDVSYVDSSKGVMVVLAENEDTYRSLTEDMHTMEDDVLSRMRNVQLRVVRNADAFREKLLLFDYDEDDRFIEILKFMLMSFIPEQYRPDHIEYDIESIKNKDREILRFYKNGSVLPTYVELYDSELDALKNMIQSFVAGTDFQSDIEIDEIWAEQLWDAISQDGANVNRS